MVCDFKAAKAEIKRLAFKSGVSPDAFERRAHKYLLALLVTLQIATHTTFRSTLSFASEEIVTPSLLDGMKKMSQVMDKTRQSTENEIKSLKKQLKKSQEKHGKVSGETRDLYLAISRQYGAMADFIEKTNFTKKALKIQEALTGEESIEVMDLLIELAHAYNMTGLSNEANKYLKKAESIASKHPDLPESKKTLLLTFRNVNDMFRSKQSIEQTQAHMNEILKKQNMPTPDQEKHGQTNEPRVVTAEKRRHLLGETESEKVVDEFKPIIPPDVFVPGYLNPGLLNDQSSYVHQPLTYGQSGTTGSSEENKANRENQ